MGNKLGRGKKVIKTDSNSTSEEEDQGHMDTIRDADFSWLDGRRVSDYLFERYNEETENLTLMRHITYKYVLKSNTFAKFSPRTKNCLHIGSGHKIWLVEMANEFEGCHFEGFDIAVAADVDTRSTVLLPSNANFRHGDIFGEGLPYPDDHFDYVNVRNLLSWIHCDKIPLVLKEVKRVTKKDCLIELLEMDVIVRNPASLYEEHLGKIWKEVCKDQGYVPSNIIHMDKYFSQQEFSDVKLTKFSLPIGDYGGKVGKLYAKQIAYGCNAFATIIKNKLDKTDEDIQAYIKASVKELNMNQSYTNMYILCARKF